MSSSINRNTGTTTFRSNLKPSRSQIVYDLRLQSIKEYQEIIHYLQQINSKLEALNTIIIPKLNETLRVGERLITTIYTLFKSTVFTVDQLSKNQLREKQSEFTGGNRRDTELNNIRMGTGGYGDRFGGDGTMMRSSPPVHNYTRDLVDDANRNRGNDNNNNHNNNNGNNEELPWFTSLYETNRPKLI